MRYGAINTKSEWGRLLFSLSNGTYLLRQGTDKYRIVDEGNHYKVMEHYMSAGCGGAQRPRERKISKRNNNDDLNMYLDDIVNSFKEG